MSAHCCDVPDPCETVEISGYRRILWVALAINGTMFLAELGAGIASASAALQADSLDFLGDAGNYGVSLLVVGATLRYRAKAALLKGATMGALGLLVLLSTAWHAFNGTLPEAATMGTVGCIALLANAVVLALLWRYRAGDSNRRSVWLCTRNDVLGNLAVLLAAFGVFGTGSGWPDMLVAIVMASLALHAAVAIVRHARAELREGDRSSNLHLQGEAV